MKQRTDAQVLSVLLSKVERIPFSGCWIWMASCMPSEYGNIGYKGTSDYAHRVSWLLHNGPIPDGAYVLHRCDIRCCVNPNHLFLGSALDNAQEMIQKGRQRFHWKKGQTAHNKGKPSHIAKENHGMAKLTEHDIAEIRRRYEEGEAQKMLGAAFGVHQSHISRIIRIENWK